MSPLDKLSAGAAKLFQIAEGSRDNGTKIALKEISATIRCTIASIRAAVEAEAEKPERPGKFALLQGDETPPPRAKTSKPPSPTKGVK